MKKNCLLIVSTKHKIGGKMKDITRNIQVKFNQYNMKYQEKLTRPEQKFLRKFGYGLFRSGQVHITRIASSLEEDISKKKTCERLTRHLQKEDLGDRILDMHLTKNRRVFSRSRYLIIDGSDINKPHATTMEGIGRVHDGSTGEIVNGYWLMNMIGVEPKNECIHMLNSRLYSFSKYEDPEISENKVILGMTAKHREKVSEDQIVVIDRGGDRRVLIEQFLAWNQQFIIRQTGSRHLFFRNEEVLLKKLARKIHLTQTVEVKKLHGGRIAKRLFHCGAIQVKFPHQYQSSPYAKNLWLVRMRDSRGAESWYLANLNTEQKEEAIITVLEGYGWRWRIEEVHRQIKQDFRLEKLSLRRYNSLKNFMIIFWVMMNFVYQYLYDKGYQIILACSEPLLYRGKISELNGFVYYKLTYALRLLLLKTSCRDKHSIVKKTENQLTFQFI